MTIKPIQFTGWIKTVEDHETGHKRIRVVLDCLDYKRVIVGAWGIITESEAVNVLERSANELASFIFRQTDQVS